jgi:hypothetical protein
MALLNANFEVFPCPVSEIKQVIEDNHYSESINGVHSVYSFKLCRDGQIIGGMIYGGLGMANAWKKYASKPEDVIELRRLAIIDDTPKNSESFFIARTLKWLRKNTQVKIVVSYADANYGHNGTIYKASNFNMIGMTSAGRVIMWQGKKYHDKAIRTKYKGELKPFAKRIKAALESGEAYYVKQDPKFIYTYALKV